MNLENKIEALLFYKNEPLEIKKISKILNISESETREALKNLAVLLENRGVCLVETKDEVSLATAPDMKDFIEQIAKDEMSREIGKAGLETLSIILYNGPVSRREIDYVRGVNSTFILRNLCIRGLVEKETDTKDQRVLKYKGSLSLLTHLGLRKIEDLPEFQNFKEQIDNSKNIMEEKENNE
ncbi:MAG: SMC-Scp complex subunit ScpB [Patescibacteria group bacterium]